MKHKNLIEGFTSSISIFIFSAFIIYIGYYLVAYFYSTFISYNILSGFCTGDVGCIAFFLFIVLPFYGLLAIIFTFFIKKRGLKKGLLDSLIVFALLVVVLTIISARNIYLDDSSSLNKAVTSMRNLDEQISNVAQNKNSKVCFTGFSQYSDYLLLLGYSSNTGNPVTPDTIDNAGNQSYVQGNGIITSTFYTKFKLFKTLLSDKIIDKVQITTKPVKNTESYYQLKTIYGTKYNQNLAPYIYLDYRDSLDLRAKRGDPFKLGSCKTLEIENLGKNSQGKSIILLTSYIQTF